MFYMFMIQLLGETQVRPEGGGELRQCHARYNLVQLLEVIPAQIFESVV
jgi:hypothetical protein